MANPNKHLLPTFKQAVFAACFGIIFGLLLSYSMDKHQPLTVGKIEKETKVDIVQKESVESKKTGFFNIPKITFWPTLTNRTNILLMGVDSNGRNTKRFEHTRSDTMILASIDPYNKKVGLISIPRDSRMRVSEKVGLEKINSAHALGGPELAVKAIEKALSIPIDHYIVIDRVGVKDVFKMVGPVEVNVEKRMRYHDRAAGLHIDLKPGLQELDPEQVEQYLRFRYDQKGDIGRIARQQWFLRQAQKKLKDPSVLLKIPEMIQVANTYVHTDMSVQDMTALIGFGKDINSESIETATLPGEASTIHGGSYWIIDPEASALVLKRLAGVSPSVQRIAEATSEYEEDDIDVDIAFEEDYSPELHTNDSFQKVWSDSISEKPYSVKIRYPRGQEQTARDFQQSLSLAGYKVRSLVRCRLGDCQHEKIELNSFRADDSVSSYLKKKFPEFKSWAIVMSPSQKTRTDLTIQITPETQALLPHEAVKATFDFEVSGYGLGEIKSSRAKKSSRYNKG